MLGFRLGAGYFLVTYHPVTLQCGDPAAPAREMLTALDAFPDELGVKELAERPTPAGRSVLPQDVANVVAMLCGQDAEMIRGQIITVDGGETVFHR